MLGVKVRPTIQSEAYGAVLGQCLRLVSWTLLYDVTFADPVVLAVSPMLIAISVVAVFGPAPVLR
jgi:hypothetical protein